MYSIVHTKKEIDLEYDFKVINLIETMKPFWVAEEPYPGRPYNHNLFKQYYSDHHPVEFRMLAVGDDD